MSVKPPPAPPRDAGRLVNPVIRRYMETTNLERFYGGYVIAPLQEGVYNLGIGEVGAIPLATPLYELYKRFIQSDELSRLALRYSGTHGERETNRAVAARLNGWLGVERFHHGLVVSVDGGQNAAEVAVRSFTAPLGSPAWTKQYVLLAAPCYPYFSAIVSSQAGLQSFLAYDGEMLAAGVERFCNPAVGLILLNVPHNPMGYGLSVAQVERINRVAQHHDCALLVDVVYANYARDVEVGRALGRLDPERTIFSDSFSKQYGYPGLRLGFAVSAAERLTYAMRFVKMSESLTPSNVKLAFAGHLLDHHADIPARIAREVTARHDRFMAAFRPAAHLDVRPFGGRPNPFYLAVDVGALVRRTGLSEAQIADHLLTAHRVKVFPGQFIYPNAALAHETFTDVGRPAGAGPLPFAPPRFAPGAQIVYAPDYFTGRIPLLRLSFGMETRMEEAAAVLGQGLAAVWDGAAQHLLEKAVHTQHA
ncbi:MAG: pyridoxal phosphate-dependent aminotransferase [Candidatus Lambdaproteobacteria bacterium]|nr:pyridoxal phosphate-dependent aminotransferase [Candidatus Lambdaproteobacteria bacterium]